MSITTLTSREFNQDLGRAKRAAETGPVFVTDRGRLSFVLVSYEEWELLAGKGKTIAEALSGELLAADIEFDVEPDRAAAQPAEFD
jgi:prevent-host-death family protein